MDVIQQLAPFVIEQGIKHVSKNLNSPASDLATEASKDNTYAIKSMLSKNPSINRGPAMVAAASAGYLGVLDLLLELPKSSSHDHDHDQDHHHYHHETIEVNIWANGTTPLRSAVKEHHKKQPERSSKPVLTLNLDIRTERQPSKRQLELEKLKS